jgi:prophage antirepressor-like protein
MNNLQTFNFEQFGRVRIVVRDGEPWFVAKDVCDILGHTNVTVALQMLDDDEKDFLTRASNPKKSLGSLGGEGREGGAQSLNIVSESGLYTLIMRSNKPIAKPFRRWVTHEVLPAIRKTGRYVMPKKTYTKTEIEEAGKEFFTECYREGGVELYLKRRHPDRYEECIDPRKRAEPVTLLTRPEKRWLEEIESVEFLTKENRL